MSVNITKGQVWEDKDRRRVGRTFVVEDVVNNNAICKSANGNKTKFTKIRLDRFIPKYYRLRTDGSITQSKTNNWKPKPKLPTGRVVSISGDVQIAGPPTPLGLAGVCTSMLRGTWTEVSPNVVESANDPFKLMVFHTSPDIYDVKIMLDGIIIDTWVASHVDVTMVLGLLRSRVEDLRNSLGKWLN